jgi:hypothetical protein
MDSRELYRIALGQKWVIGLIAAMLLVIILLSLVAQGTNLSSLTPVFRVLGWVYAVTFIYWIVNLARGLANPISWFLVGLLLVSNLPVIPQKLAFLVLLIDMICLWALFQRATAVLRANKLKVGLFGANLRNISRT